MALTADQALAIQRARGIAVRPIPGGWRAETAKGERLGGKPPYATPEAALEAAEAALVATEAREQETRARRLLDALERGRYFLRPRTTTVPDPVTGQPTTRLVFDAFRPDNTAILAVRGRESYLQAVIDLEGLLGP